jgi:AbrB family looped-hinge helix DNA binding protein
MEKSARISRRWQNMTDTVILGESGRIVLPASVRKEFGLAPGERLTVVADDGEIRIFSRKMILDSVRARILKKRGTLKGILDEFLEERREQARREAEGE